MKIKTSAIPEWFFSSSMFNLETNISSPNYNSPKQRIYDYSTFPTYTAPSNKIAGHPEYDYTFMKNQRNSSSRIDPGEQVGYNIFPKFNGKLPQDTATFLNAYSSSQQIRFTNEGGKYNNTTDNRLSLSISGEALQWVNGEQGIGYTIEPQYYQNVRDMLTTAKSNPISSGSKYGVYSLQAFPDVWNNFGYIDGSSTGLTAVNTLCNYLENPPTSVMEETGFDFLCEDLYSIDEWDATHYGAMGIYMKQLARKKYSQTNKEIYKKFYYILWSNTEFLNNRISYKKNNSNNLISNGEGASLTKPPSCIHLNYSLALAGVTIADGFWHFIDRFCTFGPVDIINENGTVAESNVDLEQYNINGTINNIDNTYPSPEGGGKTTYLRGQYYKILPAMTWLGVNQYAALAIWHAYLQRDIIQDTTYDWFTPDFRNMNGVRRIENEKRIPYNLHYNEPTVEAKYSADKTECLLYVCNFTPSVSNATTPYIVKVILNPTGTPNGEIEVPVVLKSSKAELVRVTF